MMRWNQGRDMRTLPEALGLLWKLPAKKPQFSPLGICQPTFITIGLFPLATGASADMSSGHLSRYCQKIIWTHLLTSLQGFQLSLASWGVGGSWEQLMDFELFNCAHLWCQELLWVPRGICRHSPTPLIPPGHTSTVLHTGMLHLQGDLLRWGCQEQMSELEPAELSSGAAPVAPAVPGTSPTWAWHHPGVQHLQEVP